MRIADNEMLFFDEVLIGIEVHVVYKKKKSRTPGSCMRSRLRKRSRHKRYLIWQMPERRGHFSRTATQRKSRCSV